MKINVDIQRTEVEVVTHVESSDWSDPVEVIINMILATRTVCAKYKITDQQMIGLIKSSLSHVPSIDGTDDLDINHVEVEA